MSTYYAFACLKCETTGGFFSRQAWGIGNADLVASFKFYAVHAIECGAEHVRVLHEGDARNEWPNQTNDPAWLLEHKAVFPRADEWALSRAEPDGAKAVDRINAWMLSRAERRRDKEEPK